MPGAAAFGGACPDVIPTEAAQLFPGSRYSAREHNTLSIPLPLSGQEAKPAFGSASVF